MQWAKYEVELIVASYFSMLEKELLGEKYSKAEHRRELLSLLNNRSKGSIEFKHQNISAVLIKFGQTYLKGYLPRYNYKKMLEDVVLDQLVSNISLMEKVEEFVSKSISRPDLSKVNFNSILVDAPKTNIYQEPDLEYNKHSIKINYLKKEQENAHLGELGEEFIIEYERFHLKKIGYPSLSKKVIWVSKEEGDGLGYDILSKNPDGSDKFIEVKTTKLGKETPFYFSRNELRFSLENRKYYHLYRVFDFRDNAKLFIKNGSLSDVCNYEPLSFKGYF